jgi:hypothetical protein
MDSYGNIKTLYQRNWHVETIAAKLVKWRIQYFRR